LLSDYQLLQEGPFHGFLPWTMLCQWVRCWVQLL